MKLEFIEADVGVTGRNDFGATIVSVLTEFGDHDARLALILLVVLPLLYLFTRVVQKRMLKAQLQNRAAVEIGRAHV